VARNDGNTLVTQRDMAAQVLSRPDQFPAAFLSWLKRFLADNRAGTTTVPDSGGVSDGGNGLLVLWEGSTAPISVGPGAVWIIPQVNGADVTFQLVRQTMISFPATVGTWVAETQLSTDGGSTWSTIVANSLASTTEDVEVAPGTITSGNLIRINWLSFGSSIGAWTLQLEGKINTIPGVTGGVTKITSVDSSVTITDPEGPITDLSVGAVSGAVLYDTPTEGGSLSITTLTGDIDIVSDGHFVVTTGAFPHQQSISINEGGGIFLSGDANGSGADIELIAADSNIVLAGGDAGISIGASGAAIIEIEAPDSGGSVHITAPEVQLAANNEATPEVRVIPNAVGFFNATPVGQAATPSTLADVIAIIRALGLSS
jgi:hypothetical protein